MSVTVEQKHRKLATEIFGCLSTHSAAYLIAEAMQEVRRQALEEAANEARCGNNGHDPSERIAAAIRALADS